MKNIKFLAVFLSAVILLTGCSNEERLKEQQTLKQEGMQLQAEGDYQGAIKKYEEALKLADMKVGREEIDLSYYKASAQYRSGDLAGAIKTYSAVLAVREDENSHLGRGLLYAAAGEKEKAEKDLNEALRETDDPIIQGIIYNVVENTKKAKQCFEEAKESGHPEAGFYLADLYETEGDHEHAMSLLAEYLKSGKATAEGCLVAGRTYFEDAGYEKALSAIQQGIALGESGVLKNLLREEIACMERLGDFEGAKEKAAVYLSKFPEDEIVEKEYEFLKTR